MLQQKLVDETRSGWVWRGFIEEFERDLLKSLKGVRKRFENWF